MIVTFHKYQGAGNDFIIIDNRAKNFPKDNVSLISNLCDRYFGIGADGLILLEEDAKTDFKMIYFNSDGNQGTMCGNGGRCIVAFARKLELFKDKTSFMAVDGLHYASIENGAVSLQMTDVKDIEIYDNHTFIDTGSPHHIELVKDIVDFPVFSEGRKIRNSVYGAEGSNVNFVEQINSSTFKVRTYERGVENETLACGTGVTAVAIAMHKTKMTKSNYIVLSVKGGTLEVCFNVVNDIYKNVFLKGSATFVFEGTIEI